MSWASRSKAERFAEFWRFTGLLGCYDWKVCAVSDEPAASDDPDQGQPAAQTAQAPLAANDMLATARDELVELLASKDALIAELQRKLNERTLQSVREAAAQNKRIAELEQQLAVKTRRRGNGR